MNAQVSQTTNFKLIEKPYEYVRRLIDLGVFEGAVGQQRVNPQLEPAMEIIHKILAGAKLEITIREVSPPDGDILRGLMAFRKEAEEQANEINARGGDQVVPLVP